MSAVALRVAAERAFAGNAKSDAPRKQIVKGLALFATRSSTDLATDAAGGMGVEQAIVRKSGAWYTYEGDQLGQGKENARKFLRDNPDVADEIEKRIKEKLGIGAKLDAEAPAAAPVDF